MTDLKVATRFPICAQEKDLPLIDSGQQRAAYGSNHMLRVDDIGDGAGVAFISYRPPEGFYSPHHRHPATSHIRYIVSGNMQYGDGETVTAGDVIVVPQGT